MAAPWRNLTKTAGAPPSLQAPRLLSASNAAATQLPSLAHLVPLVLAPVPTCPPGSSPEHGLQIPSRPLTQTFFDRTAPSSTGRDNSKDDSRDPNKAKLGKTLRILQERLPTLLQSPLPQDILAPNISLRLFPSTHPHLPTVSGKVAYNAALWTSPIAWNRVPIIGNVKLEILAERVTSEPLTFLPRRAGAIPEQLVVRWCEKRRCDGHLPEPGGIARALWRGRGADPNKAFTGLFIFDFDSEGRVLTHTIEQAQEGGNWESGMGAKFVGLTDWLLGGMKTGDDNPIPTFKSLDKVT
ncbi:uncharacterized protein UV8b_01354 [Ustilaginoidea virens]|uniref:Chromosome transmission fidelity protein 4 n=1 Tax=Ustilaginoidea virens TaxID=1159556 RepID=A0A8E5HKU9_USTVR|nr:uncharacterized protein UV8b_01354 [Ustilaginoidea virens]QUC17113.1 hypothetical protein UV8b_01354 [Ustilaginoidea virens]